MERITAHLAQLELENDRSSPASYYGDLISKGLERTRKHNYSSLSYWDQRYEDSPDDECEWLLSCEELAPLISCFMEKNDAILIPGCG
jgi:hypothetical protein